MQEAYSRRGSATRAAVSTCTAAAPAASRVAAHTSAVVPEVITSSMSSTRPAGEAAGRRPGRTADGAGELGPAGRRGPMPAQRRPSAAGADERVAQPPGGGPAGRAPRRAARTGCSAGGAAGSGAAAPAPAAPPAASRAPARRGPSARARPRAVLGAVGVFECAGSACRLSVVVAERGAGLGVKAGGSASHRLQAPPCAPAASP